MRRQRDEVVVRRGVEREREGEGANGVVVRRRLPVNDVGDAQREVHGAVVEVEAHARGEHEAVRRELLALDRGEHVASVDGERLLAPRVPEHRHDARVAEVRVDGARLLERDLAVALKSAQRD